MIKNKHLFILLLLFPAINSFSQSFWRADLQPVDRSGYYNIELSQTVIGLSKNKEFTDLKVLDDKNQEVPYFLRSVTPEHKISEYEAYDLKENTTKNNLSIVIVDNKKQENIKQFVIVLTNADANKDISIRGSNDLNKWYIVKQKTDLPLPGSDFGIDKNTELLTVDFPQGNYRYYEITLSTNQKSPLEILKIVKVKYSAIYADFTWIDLGSLVQRNDVDKKTYLTFPNLSLSYRINKLEFSIKSKADYFRHVLVRDSVSQKEIGFDISSKKENTFIINDFIFSPGTVIIIENENNPPLVIDSVKVYGLNRYVCAYLEEGKNYHLQIGTQNSTLSNYDIKHFQNDIPAELPVIKTNNLQHIVKPVIQEPERETMLIENPVFLWSIIIVVGVFLAFICVRMIREMKKK